MIQNNQNSSFYEQKWWDKKYEERLNSFPQSQFSFPPEIIYWHVDVCSLVLSLVYCSTFFSLVG